MNRPAKIATMAISLLVMNLAGCKEATQYVWRQPVVALRGVRLEGIGITGGTLRVALMVRNPNFYPLTTAGMRYRLLVRDSVAIADGVDSTAHRVPAHDSTVVELPLRVAWQGLSAAGSDMVNNGLVTYRLVGDITLDTPVGKHDLPVSQTGRFAAVR
ncbi:MAG TPA: LEA type 2 family protein [Gemmatimonadaceae bacterium]|jgi:LEA14-like dessication related protein|nr:LEA type 2 family protein [Gemmatimonadaceae bacterium]